MDGPFALRVGAAGVWALGLGGEGALGATSEGDCGLVTDFPEAVLELADTTEPGLEVMRLGLRSGVPLAYMNLLARGSGAGAAKGGEYGADAAMFGPDFEGKSSPLA